MLGRAVPWASWDEWHATRCGLYSASLTAQQRALDQVSLCFVVYLTCVFGFVRNVRTACHHCQRSVLLVQVSAWRCRGRIPLGADVTAALVQTGRRSLGAGIGDGALPAELLRLQYAMSIVRLVNGIADSSQKGRTAQSVANLAEDAGEAFAPSTQCAVYFCGLPFHLLLSGARSVSWSSCTQAAACACFLCWGAQAPGTVDTGVSEGRSDVKQRRWYWLLLGTSAQLGHPAQACRACWSTCATRPRTTSCPRWRCCRRPRAPRSPGWRLATGSARPITWRPGAAALPSCCRCGSCPSPGAGAAAQAASAACRIFRAESVLPRLMLRTSSQLALVCGAPRPLLAPQSSLCTAHQHGQLRPCCSTQCLPWPQEYAQLQRAAALKGSSADGLPDGASDNDGGTPGTQAPAAGGGQAPGASALRPARAVLVDLRARAPVAAAALLVPPLLDGGAGLGRALLWDAGLHARIDVAAKLLILWLQVLALAI